MVVLFHPVSIGGLFVSFCVYFMLLFISWACFLLRGTTVSVLEQDKTKKQ